MNRLYRPAAAAALAVLGLAACSSSSRPVPHQAPPPTYAPAATTAPAAGPGTSAVTVCIRPYVKAQCASNEQAEPQTITLTQDGSVNLGSITWTGWGTATATGHGLVYSDNCKPSCTQGSQSKALVTITLTSLKKWETGQAYDDMTVSGIPAPYTAQYSSFTGLAP